MTDATAIDPKQLLTVPQLAKQLRQKRSWVIDRCRKSVRARTAHPLPMIKVGRKVMFHWPAVSEWLKAQEEK